MVDAGYPQITGYLGPYKNTRYHLSDFERAGAPKGCQEIFNRAHSSLRSCIERTFGVWKKRWKILHDMPSFSFEVQRDIVVTSMAIHNYIRRKSLDDPAFIKFDEHPEVVPPDIFTDVEGFQQDGYRGKGNAREMDSLRDRIASSLELTRRS